MGEMVHFINFFFFWHPAVLTIECHCYFGFQIPLPLFLTLLRDRHIALSVSKHKSYSNLWDVVFGMRFGAKAYSIAGFTAGIRIECIINGRFWDKV